MRHGLILEVGAARARFKVEFGIGLLLRLVSSLDRNGYKSMGLRKLVCKVSLAKTYFDV